MKLPNDYAKAIQVYFKDELHHHLESVNNF